MELAKMLVLSTSHMNPQTAQEWMPACPWACFDKGDYGWFMYVCDDCAITEAEDVPLEIRSAIHVAKREECQWIMWDCDGPILQGLPDYDWHTLSVAVAATGHMTKAPAQERHVD